MRGGNVCISLLQMMMHGHFHLLLNKCFKDCLGKRKGQVWESPYLDHAFHIFVYESFGLLCFWRSTKDYLVQAWLPQW